ncbi:MAG: GTP cyclohydrolase I FolE [Planctomycetaceae bacterium]|jgi:GTP cyclohydrolase I|nr:GTP cyclohydrolase I FolE [Phycisphaerales bacterium]MCE2653593.1 GTP cyclohydrolase I FolE [Planctomycetaceae bacterium]
MIARPDSCSPCCAVQGQPAVSAAAEAAWIAEPASASSRFGPDRPAFDSPRIERAVREILLAIGEDPDREGLADTPRRVAKAYSQIFGGLREDASQHLGRVFREETDDLVMCRNIEFYTVCEHHLLPFYGKAHIAYRPDGQQVVGLSKLARTVDVFARRPQVQERLTNQIADAIMQHLGPQGVMVIVEAEHLCMKMRGVGKQGSSMMTTAVRGCFREESLMRSEVVGMLTAARP